MSPASFSLSQDLLTSALLLQVRRPVSDLLCGFGSYRGATLAGERREQWREQRSRREYGRRNHGRSCIRRFEQSCSNFSCDERRDGRHRLDDRRRFASPFDRPDVLVRLDHRHFGRDSLDVRGSDQDARNLRWRDLVRPAVLAGARELT